MFVQMCLTSARDQYPQVRVVCAKRHKRLVTLNVGGSHRRQLIRLNGRKGIDDVRAQMRVDHVRPQRRPARVIANKSALRGR